MRNEIGRDKNAFYPISFHFKAYTNSFNEKIYGCWFAVKHIKMWKYSILRRKKVGSGEHIKIK